MRSSVASMARALATPALRIGGLSFALAAVGCSDGSFSSGGARASDGKGETPADVDRQDASGDATGTKADGKKAEEPDDDVLVEEDEIQCIDQDMSLRVLFVIDSTGSMQGHINLVKTNIEQVVRGLQEITFTGEGAKSFGISDVEVGAITFKDTLPEQQTIPFGSAAVFSSRLAKVVAGGGGDTVEGGLQAFATGVNLLRAEMIDAGANGVIPLVMIISDTYGHDGSGGVGGVGGVGARNCDVNSVASTITGPEFANLLLYDATPTRPGVGCDGVATTSPSAQWEQLRQLWQGAFPDVTRKSGRGLGLPFTAEALLSSLPQEVASSFKVCR